MNHPTIDPNTFQQMFGHKFWSFTFTPIQATIYRERKSGIDIEMQVFLKRFTGTSSTPFDWKHLLQWTKKKNKSNVVKMLM